MAHAATRCLVLALLIAAAASMAMSAESNAQTIRIPDFREGAAFTSIPPGGPCDECGVVRSIREIHRSSPPLYRTPAGGPFPAGETRVIGAVMVLPFGAGSSSEKARYVGGVGTPEMNERLGELSYEVTVRMNDQTLRTVERRDGAQFAVGDRVRVAEGRLELVR